MQSNNCPEYSRLEAEVDSVLEKLVEMAQLQLETFRSKNLESFMRVDRNIELTVGHKERVVGAFKEHVREHHCQGEITLRDL